MIENMCLCVNMLVTTSAVKFKTFDDSKGSIVQLEVIISRADDELPKLRVEIIFDKAELEKQSNSNPCVV